jgi:hypothetical protein
VELRSSCSAVLQGLTEDFAFFRAEQPPDIRVAVELFDDDPPEHEMPPLRASVYAHATHPIATEPAATLTILAGHSQFTTAQHTVSESIAATRTLFMRLLISFCSHKAENSSITTGCTGYTHSA